MRKMPMKALAKLLVLVSVLFLVAACSSEGDNKKKETGKSEPVNQGEPVRGGIATIGYPQDVSNYDPVQGSAGGDHALLWPVYDTLISFTPELVAAPGLAESWEFTDDLTLVLNLREGVTFHDGTAFDAEAVKFNLERANAEDSKVSDLKSIDSVTVIDPLTVEVNLSHADTSILLALSDRGGMMVSPTAVGLDEENYSQNPVGAGPYKMVNRIPNGEITLEAYENYWEEGKPYLDKMIVKIMPDENTRINALKSGEVNFIWNIAPGNIASLESDSKIELIGDVASQFKTIYINADMEPLENKAVRLAIQYGINREALLQAINFGKGEPAYQLFPSEFWASDKDMKIEYNPEKAKEILKDAGIENPSFTMNHYSRAYDARLADALKSQLEEIGIDMKLQAMELTAAVSDYFSEKNTPALLSDWNGRPDAHMTVSGMFANNSFYNAGGYSTPEIESLLAEASALYDQDERTELYKEITRLALLEEAITIPLFFNPTAAAMTTNIKGYVPNMYGKPIISTLWIEE